MIKVIHLRQKCIGCNACVEASPEHWVMSGNDGKSHLKKSEQKGNYFILSLPDWEYDEQAQAAKNCPVNIIQVNR
ncbi:ferredoxin [Flammeovirgaceae bacterium SG7u.111]|nr:ferredoxin [Flammeovirgaceae bacterium SG7u.132]WPO33357.1 ferredoxin [Flammeovirgaceae bacterium SG7u.111]